MSSQNTFAQASNVYASARPAYPPALFEWLAGQCRAREAAWDCATGNGQAAVGLAGHFQCVYATDLSKEQVQHAARRENVRYSVASAERSGFRDGAFDLVTVAQALHWFDFPRFWAEVRRVARGEALFCAWGYDWPRIAPALDRELVQPFRAVLAPFWPAQNRILWDGYRDEDVAFPFQRIPTPRLAIELDWTMQQFVDYLTTWSAYKLSRSDASAAAAVDGLFAGARGLVPPGERLPVRMPLTLLAGRVG